MTIIVKLGIVAANILYYFIKLIPTQYNKITFISRQSNTKSLDMQLLEQELIKSNKDLKIIFLCKTLSKGLNNKIKYAFYMIKMMYHIATSKVVILDTYCIPISILKHKKELVVIQMWHALGSLKKFGYAALDNNSKINIKKINSSERRSAKLAKLMKMHKNYNYILTSSNASLKNFQEAFNAKPENMIVMNLPRVDFLKDKRNEKVLKEKFYLEYPQLNNNKKIILYSPTMRNEKFIPVKNVKNAVDYDKYILVVKYHSGKNDIFYDKNNKYSNVVFSGIDFLHIADYIISDYSAIIYEAAITMKPIYLYNFDFDNYYSKRGFFIDYYEELPAIINKNINKIMDCIEHNIIYDVNREKQFVEKYMENYKCNNTKKFSNFILSNLEEENK